MREKDLKKNKEIRTVHGEVDAIRKVPKDKKHLLSKSCLIVIQLKTHQNSDNVVGISKPCSNCQQAITTAGIKKVYWSDYDGSLVCEKY